MRGVEAAPAERRREPAPGVVDPADPRAPGDERAEALRVARWGEPALAPGAGPVVVYSNHPSWWDAAVYVLAGDRLLGSYESY
ncbi:MAG TPA: hypothetical protein VFS03_05560, partial [Microvirga sp.]|nr:hypothetical protein [Microvirga sp.]